jgi:prolyl 4-hydroxylase
MSLRIANNADGSHATLAVGVLKDRGEAAVARAPTQGSGDACRILPANPAFELRRAALTDRLALSRMLELYQHELSNVWDQDLDVNGEYGYALDKYWRDEGWHPYVFLVASRYAGFALVVPHAEGRWLEQFFVVKKYRGRGIGKAAAFTLFDELPGVWQLGQIAGMTSALDFCRRVLGAYTGGCFTERFHERGDQSTVHQFSSRNVGHIDVKAHQPAARQPQETAPAVLAGEAIKSDQIFTDELMDWVLEQVTAGRSRKAILHALLVSGWERSIAVLAVEGTIEAQDLEAMEPAPLPPPTPVPEPALQRSPVSLDVGDRRIQVLASVQRPRVVVFGGFLSDDECDELIKLARPKMVSSKTVVDETGGQVLSEMRTSTGMFIERGSHEVCSRIERRIARLLNWPIENGESIQVLNYKPGAQYRPHHDYFCNSAPGAPVLLQRGGQRVGTLLMYLNTPEEGGGTTFPDVGLEVAPVKGNAVFFSYDRPHASTKTLHGGAPVITGEKWVATKWLRQRPIA